MFDEPNAPFAQVLRDAEARFDPSRLTGRTEAGACAHVESLGGIFRAHAPDESLFADLHLNRVTAEIVDGRVRSASVG